jgi:hypothetical protein
MSRDRDGTANFERELHTLLEESVQRVGAHARSRLNQARQAAIAETARRSHWRVPLRTVEWLRPRPMWMPAMGAVAGAVLVAFVLWPHAPQGYPAVEANHATVEDLDLLADRDGMDLVQGGSDGQFYEWAMTQAGQGAQPAAPGGSAQGKASGGPDAAANSNQNSG